MPKSKIVQSVIVCLVNILNKKKVIPKIYFCRKTNLKKDIFASHRFSESKLFYKKITIFIKLASLEVLLFYCELKNNYHYIRIEKYNLI